MGRYLPPSQGTVNLGTQSNYGKMRPEAKFQALSLNPESFVSKKGEPSPAKMRVHERIKQLIASDMPRREAVKLAMAESREGKQGDTGTISQKEVYRHKFQAEKPGHQISPFKTQEQEFPFI